LTGPAVLKPVSMDAVFPAILAMDDTLDRDDAPLRAEFDADSALMLRVRAGDEKALAELIDRWKTPLINFFYRSLSSYSQAEDLAQMTFVRIYRSAPRYEPRAKFSTYLFHVARRLLINEYRHRQRKPLETVDPADLQAVSGSEETRNLSEIEEAFNQAIGNLPEKHATALLLLKQQELSYEEIANLMDASVGAVKTWIFRARAQLREELGGIL
jgi:RNA polymerase sigma-70 factor (ECF subfamily)